MLCCVVLCCAVLCCTVLYCTVRTVLYCTVLYCTVLYCTVLYCTYCTVLYCTVLYCTVLYCTVLYCTVLYCTVLYCTVLYCTVLYCTVLYCTVLYCTVLYFWYNWFVIYCQNKMECDSFSITGMGIMTSDVNCIDGPLILFQFLNWSSKKLFSLLINIWCFRRSQFLICGFLLYSGHKCSCWLKIVNHCDKRDNGVMQAGKEIKFGFKKGRMKTDVATHHASSF